MLYRAAAPPNQPIQPPQPNQPSQPTQPIQPLVVDVEAGGAALSALLAPCESGVAVLTYGNGVPKALEARAASGVPVDVIDCPMLSRLPGALPAVLQGGLTLTLTLTIALTRR